MSKFDSHARLEKKYSPDQERDERGRFGGGGSGPNIDVPVNTRASGATDRAENASRSASNTDYKQHAKAVKLHKEAAALHKEAAGNVPREADQRYHLAMAKHHENSAAIHTNKSLSGERAKMQSTLPKSEFNSPKMKQTGGGPKGPVGYSTYGGLKKYS